MAISFVGSSTGVDTAPMPAHQAGDVIVVFAYADAAAVTPALAAGFTSAPGLAGAGNSNGHRVGYRIATSATEAIGTWANATQVAVAVYRGCDPNGPIGTTANFTNVADVTYPALTLQASSGSWVVAAHGRRTGNQENVAVPAGTVLRADTGTSTAGRVVILDTSRAVTAWPQTASGGNNTFRYRSISMEMKAAPVVIEKNVGQGDATIGRVTGEARARLRIVGYGSSALAPITGESAGRLAIDGYGAGAVAPIMGEATARLKVVGRGDATIGAIAGEAFGGLASAGFGDATLPAVTGEAYGRSSIRGFGAATIEPVTGFATGSTGGPIGNVGQGDRLLPRILGGAIGRVRIRGWAEAIVTVAGEARGTVSRPPVRPSAKRTVRPPFQTRTVRPRAERRIVRATKPGAVMLSWPDKDPDDRLDYSIDWTDRLAGDGISAVDWIVPDGLTLDDSAISGAVTTIWLSGGGAETFLRITCRVTTVDGRRMDQSVRLPVTER